eukprot:m.182231 g.182231  ORF g.182231 m.182231 type:complete len:422 (-) comp17456_c3_seq9:102-1367(-)
MEGVPILPGRKMILRFVVLAVVSGVVTYALFRQQAYDRPIQLGEAAARIEAMRNAYATGAADRDVRGEPDQLVPTTTLAAAQTSTIRGRPTTTTTSTTTTSTSTSTTTSTTTSSSTTTTTTVAATTSATILQPQQGGNSSSSSSCSLTSLESCRVCLVTPFCDRVEAMLNAMLSIAMQTHTNWEVQVGLNNYNKECPITVANLPVRLREVMTDEMISRVFIHNATEREKSGNTGVMRNLAMRHCSGEFIAFLDDDDLALPDRLEIQVQQLISHPDVVIAGANAYIMEPRRNYTARFDANGVFHPLLPSRELWEQLGLGDYEFAFLIHAIENTTHDETGLGFISPIHFYRGSNFFICSLVSINRTFIVQHHLEFPDMSLVEDLHFWSHIGKVDDYKRPVLHTRTKLGGYDSGEHGRPKKRGL